MTLETFKTVFDRIKPFVKTLDLFNWGEPFLNRDIGKMVEYAKKKKPSVRIFIDSNLNVMSDEQIDLIVRNGVDVIKVSCDGATQDIYSKYRIGGDLSTVMGNVGKLIGKKRSLGKNEPRIIWKYLVFKHNESEVEKARQKASEMGIDFEASGMRVDCGKEIFEKVEDSVDRDREWIPESNEYNMYIDLSAGKRTCEKPWRTVTINWNGDVVTCGSVYDCERYKMGNILEQSFEEIWNGPAYIKARKIIVGSGSDGNIICHTCKENGYQFF